MPMTRGGHAHGARDGVAPSERQADARTARPGPPPLAPNVRRHLGLSLRTFYAATLAEPMSERIAVLLDRLGKTPPKNPFP